MQRGRLDDLRAFVAVARERSFTKAAAKLGVSAVGAEPYHPRPRSSGSGFGS